MLLPFPRRAGAALLLAGLAGAARADWVRAPEPEVVRPAPEAGQVQAQNPPAFRWARAPGNPSGYVLELRRGTRVFATWESARNWYLPTRALPAGQYSWRVRPASGGTWSDARAFTMPADAPVFEVPPTAALMAVACARPRPRQLPPGAAPVSAWTPAMRADRAHALAALQAEVDSHAATLKVPGDASWPLVTGRAVTAATNAQNADIRHTLDRTARQLEGAALLYRLTGAARYRDEALRRGDQLAALDPDGPTAYAHQDQGTRAVALALMKAIDLLAGDLDAARRARWLRVVELRTKQIYADLDGANRGRLDQYPFDSHGGTNFSFLAVIAALAVGELPAAERWFDFAVRAYVNSVSPWSGPEGGFANGTAYAQYTADLALQAWPPLAAATGVDLFAKPWAQGFVRYLAEFVPPGAPRHVFGDESELAPDFSPLKGFAERVRTPEAAWYARALRTDGDPLLALTAPYPLPVRRVRAAAPPPDAALFPSIGWVAMHSSLSDARRTSLYFKSSPYGSYNHSHGDQNSIVLFARGQPLLIASGYEDYYDSPLFRDWYRQTRAANAITYDGGVGQLTAGNTVNLGRNGRITAFAASAALASATGEAQPAYGPALQQAERRVWYLRAQDAFVVRDLLRAPAAHSWEWNLHSPAPQRVQEGSAPGAAPEVAIASGGASVCLRPLGPAGAELPRYQPRTGPPPRRGQAEFHGAFVSAPAARAELLMLLDVGCHHPATRLTGSGAARQLVVGGTVLPLPAGAD